MEEATTGIAAKKSKAVTEQQHMERSPPSLSHAGRNDSSAAGLSGPEPVCSGGAAALPGLRRLGPGPGVATRPLPRAARAGPHGHLPSDPAHWAWMGHGWPSGFAI